MQCRLFACICMFYMPSEKTQCICAMIIMVYIYRICGDNRLLCIPIKKIWLSIIVNSCALKKNSFIQMMKYMA